MYWGISRLTAYWTVLLFICFISSASGASTDPKEKLQPTQARMRLTYESLRLPRNEKMGFLGGTLLYNANEWFSAGPGVYGALTGEQGGFITLGLAAELRRPLTDNIEAQAGLFIGAGGGGGLNLSGGGLMLRTHAGVSVKSTSLGNLGAGISYVSFPDGTISSTQPYIAMEIPFDTIIGSGWISRKSGFSQAKKYKSENKQGFSITYRRYSIPGGVKTDSGKKQYPEMRLMGVEWHKMLAENWYLTLGADGAMGGQSNGYMQILLGGGYRYVLGKKTYAKLSASAGVAGGGDVATGGGGIVATSLAFQQMLTKRLFIEAEGGYITAPDGDFKAKIFATKIGYAFSTPGTQREFISLGGLSSYEPIHLRMRNTYQKYFKAAPDWRSQHSHLNVENLGIQLDYFVAENYYLTGQGLAAFRGKAGAYMAGLLGGGVHFPISNGPIFVDGEVLLGAAGGGGLRVGGGLVWQANAGFGYQISDKYSIICSYGRMEAPRGAFKANVVSLSFAYNFTFFAK